MANIDFILSGLPDDYNKERESNVYKVLSGIASEMDVFINEMERVKNARFIDYAVNEEIDKLAAILNVTRFPGENDVSFKGRVKARVPSFIGGGTLDAIKKVVQIFLNVEPMIIEHYNADEHHPVLVNGVFNGMDISLTGGMKVKIGSGYSYINGTRITSNQYTLNLSSYSGPRTDYIYLVNSGMLEITQTETYDANTRIPIISVTIPSNNILTPESITDKRRILNPYEDAITNTGTITIQIPYDFDEGLVSLQDVKNIIRSTKAAGIAVLMEIYGSYQESIKVEEGKMDFTFLVGFSGIGGSNFLGG